MLLAFVFSNLGICGLENKSKMRLFGDELTDSVKLVKMMKIE